MKPTLEYLRGRILVDLERGVVTWIDATKHHENLNGCEAGSPRGGIRNGKSYWHIKINGLAIKRSHIVFLFATGSWPRQQIDHINGNSLDDRLCNLREVTVTQNAWNHKKRAKKENTPMGVRRMASGRFQARIACNKKQIVIGAFDTEKEAHDAYITKRKELYREYSGL